MGMKILVEYLSEHGANTNKKNGGRGNTIFLMHVYLEIINIIKYLLEIGADIKMRKINMVTPHYLLLHVK